MNLLDTTAYYSIANLNLWLKVKSNDRLTLADVPQIVPLRWTFISNNWETFLLPDIISRLSSLNNSSLTKEQVDAFTQYIEQQRISAASILVNPLSSSDIFFRFYLVFDAIFIDSAPITAQEQTIIDTNIAKVNNYIKTDFLTIKNNIVIARDALADSVNGTDPTYNQFYNRSPSPAQIPISIESVTQMQLYNNNIKVIDFILANIFFLDSSFVDPFALAIHNANNPDFNIDVYASGSLVRLFVGEDLQGLARRYFNDPDKWIDIAIANGLKPPYVDEAGEAIPLITNGEQDEINIARLDLLGNENIDKLFINQIVFLQSNVYNFPDQRTIINITQVPITGEIIIELSGTNNLNNYKTIDNATVRIFKPNTINSQFLVLIPSTDGVNQKPGEIPYFLRSSGQDLINAKVDLLLSNTGDLIINPNNDFQLSYGLVNAVQAIKLKLLIEQGSLQRHPEYGFVVTQGSKNNNSILTKATIIESVSDQISIDPRFDRIESLDVSYFGAGSQGPTGYLINMVVRMAGSNTNIPISFSVNVS